MVELCKLLSPLRGLGAWIGCALVETRFIASGSEHNLFVLRTREVVCGWGDAMNRVFTMRRIAYHVSRSWGIGVILYRPFRADLGGDWFVT